MFTFISLISPVDVEFVGLFSPILLVSAFFMFLGLALVAIIAFFIFLGRFLAASFSENHEEEEQIKWKK